MIETKYASGVKGCSCVFVVRCFEEGELESVVHQVEGVDLVVFVLLEVDGICEVLVGIVPSISCPYRVQILCLSTANRGGVVGAHRGEGVVSTTATLFFVYHGHQYGNLYTCNTVYFVYDTHRHAIHHHASIIHIAHLASQSTYQTYCLGKISTL